MNTRPPSFSKKLSFWKKRERFSSFTFDEDITRLQKFYQKNGFLKPEISYQLQPTANSKKLDIAIKINEGKAVLTGKVLFHLSGNGNGQYSMESLSKLVPLKTGHRFRDEDVIATEKMIYDNFSSKGYPYIQVSTEITLSLDKEFADVVFNIYPGQKSYIGAIELEGDSLISRSYINKNIKLREDEIFTQAKLERTQEQLFDLGLFQYVIIRANMDSVENDRIPIYILLKELPRWSLRTGLGYGTEDKVRVSLLLKRLSFLGGGRSLTLKGRHSYFIPLSIETKFIQPQLWGKKIDFILNPFFSREREESYEVDRWGTSLTLQKVFSKKKSAYISYSYGKDRVDIKRASLSLDADQIDTLNNTKSGVTLGYNKNGTNNLFTPSTGWKFGAMATYMGLGFKSQFHYYKIILELAGFYPLGEDVVLAGKVKGGTIEPIQGDIQTPIEDRFLIGGALSLRGWGRHQISPVDEEGIEVGGNSMLESSVELRYPLFGIFSGVTFMDMGNVWSGSWEFAPGSFRYDAGLGLRIKTPVGPVRLDFATPVFGEKFNLQFFITIGHAF